VAETKDAKQGVSVKPIACLLSICVVAGCLLGLVNNVTAPVAARVEEERANATYATLAEGATTFEEVPCQVEGCVAALDAKDDAGTLVGHIIVTQSKGYGGQVPLALAVSDEGQVLALSVMSNEETPGLGTRATEQGYLSQYVGRTVEHLEAGDVDLVSGATITSKAVLADFDIAALVFEEVWK